MRKILKINRMWLATVLFMIICSFVIFYWFPLPYSQRDVEIDQIYDRLFQEESYIKPKDGVRLSNKVLPTYYYYHPQDQPVDYETWLQADHGGRRIVETQAEAWAMRAVYAYDDFDEEMLLACQTVIRELDKIAAAGGVTSSGIFIYLNDFKTAGGAPHPRIIYVKNGRVSKKYSDPSIYKLVKRNRALKKAFQILEEKGMKGIEYGVDNSHFDDINNHYMESWPIKFFHQEHTGGYYYYTQYIRYTPEDDLDYTTIVEENQWGVYHQPDWGYGRSQFYPFQQIKEELVPAYLEAYEAP